MEIRGIKQRERQRIKEMTENSNAKFIREFYGYWKFVQNGWKPHEVKVATIDNEIIGFIANKFNKTKPYVNNYAMFVEKEHRRKGICLKLWDRTLKVAKNRGKTRLKAQSETKKGIKFFEQGLNLKPVAKRGKEYLYDVYIAGINDIDTFLEHVQTENAYLRPPKYQLKEYLKCDEFYLKDKWINI